MANMLNLSYGSRGSTYKIFKNSSDPLVLNKKLTQINQGDAMLWGDNVLKNATLELNFNQELLDANMFYHQGTNRYYDIVEHELLTGKRIRLHGKVNLYMTVASQLKNCKATFTRCDVENKDIEDNLVMRTNKVKQRQIHLGSVPTSHTQGGNTVRTGTLVTTINVI